MHSHDGRAIVILLCAFVLVAALAATVLSRM
jgi:hypothetical protein